MSAHLRSITAMTSTNFTVSDLSLKEAGELIKTFFFLSVGFSILYGILFAMGTFGASAPAPLGSLFNSLWAKAVLYTLLAFVTAKYLVQILEFLGQFFLDLMDAIRECSFLGRLGVVLLIFGGIVSAVYYPIIFFGFSIPVLGVIGGYQRIKQEKVVTGQ